MSRRQSGIRVDLKFRQWGNLAQLTKELRQRVMREAGWKCYRCGIGINSLAGEIHHRDGNHENNNIPNLRPVCKKCHKDLSKAQTKRRARDSWF